MLRRDLLLTARCLGDCAAIEPTLAREVADELTTLCLYRSDKGNYEPLRRRVLAMLSGLATGEVGQEIQRQLLAALQDKELFVRRSAASALGQLGQAFDAIVNALLAALQDNNEYVQNAAWEAVWTLTSDRAVGSEATSG